MKKKQNIPFREYAFYINVDTIPQNEVATFMKRVKDALDSKDNNTSKYFIPIREGQTRIELLYPPPTILIQKKESKKKKDKEMNDKFMWDPDDIKFENNNTNPMTSKQVAILFGTLFVVILIILLLLDIWNKTN